MFFRFHYIREDILDLKNTIFYEHIILPSPELQSSYMKINSKKYKSLFYIL